MYLFYVCLYLLIANHRPTSLRSVGIESLAAAHYSQSLYSNRRTFPCLIRLFVECARPSLTLSLLFGDGSCSREGVPYQFDHELVGDKVWFGAIFLKIYLVLQLLCTLCVYRFSITKSTWLQAFPPPVPPGKSCPGRRGRPSRGSVCHSGGRTSRLRPF